MVLRMSRWLSANEIRKKNNALNDKAWYNFLQKIISIKHKGSARVHTGLGKHGKSWHLWHFWDFPWKNTSGPRKVWKSVKLKLKNIVLKYMAGSKENWHWDLVSERVNGPGLIVLEKSFWVLDKSCKFVSEKGYEPRPV